MSHEVDARVESHAATETPIGEVAALTLITHAPVPPDAV